jgi:Domain of unknown function (DUF4350)
MSYRVELGLVLLLAGAITIAALAANRTPKPPVLDYRTSTMMSGPNGSKALHEVLVRLGHPSERRRTALFDLAGDSVRRPALLAVIDPVINLEPAELEQVARFVNEGGDVLAAGDGGGITDCAGWEPELPAKGLAMDSVAVRSPRPDLRLPRVARVLKRAADLQHLVKRRFQGEEDPCAIMIRHRIDTLLATVDGRPAALRLGYAGGGTITLVADAGWFRNRVWRDTDVPYVVLPLLTTHSRRGRVAWDEYHQGFGREGPSLATTTWEWLRHSPAGWAILQLLAVGLVWLGVTAVRFGPPRSVIERRRRSPLEHLEALAAGLESASASDVGVQRIVSGLHRRLSRTGILASDPQRLASWLDGLQLAMSGDRGRRAVRRLRDLITERGSGERVLAAAQAVEDVWEELRPRTTRDAF